MKFIIEVLDTTTNTWIQVAHGYGTITNVEKALDWARVQSNYYCRVIIT